MDLKLSGQVVFIAGSSRGIGRGIASTLLAEGTRIILTGRDPVSLANTHAELASTTDAGNRILSIPGDFSKTDVIKTALDQSASHYGRIDHLIANIGTGSGKPGWQQDESEWARLFEANLFSSVRLAEAAIPYLRHHGDSSILFISSIVAVEATSAPLPYSSAKAALTNYAKNLSRLVAPDGIRVNTLCPGNIFFPGGSWERHLTNRRAAVEAMLQNEVPLQRFGTPEEVASLAAYLCSCLASFTTGSTFIMDGGQTRTV